MADMMRSRYDVKVIDERIYVVRRDGEKVPIYLDAETRGFDWDTACGVIDAVNELEKRPVARRRSKFHTLPFSRPPD